jgi:DNA phosphorothioation system restriction enzyme
MDAIERGYGSKDAVLEAAATRSMTDPEDELTRSRLEALAWMIAAGHLDIKLAFRVDKETNTIAYGIYHEKIGIFSDAAQNHVAFTGSGNETEGGLVTNFESIDVFCSWVDSPRTTRKLGDFQRLWQNQTKGLEVLDFNRVSKSLLESYRRDRPPDIAVELGEWSSRPFGTPTRFARPRQPRAVALRAYQETAIASWLKAKGKGILQMATGTGKTITALAAATQLATKGLQAVIVLCPYKHLVTQWATECRKFEMEPILAFETMARWSDDLTTRLSRVSTEEGYFLCVIVTNSTFCSDAFQQRLPYFPTRTLLIADEVHNLGAERNANALPESVQLRLGLSATPERWFDEEGTQRLFDYFGRILEPQLGIREAIELGALTRYRYYPILVELTPDEREEYLELSAKISRFFDEREDESKSTALNALLLKRARLVGAAANKLPALRKIADKHRNSTHMLFYCGDGQVDSDEDDAVIRRQVEEVARILGNEMQIRVATYTAETSTDDREELRNDLASGKLQGLVAIRCLDEGVDIPSVRMAVILASSTNPRQFVQRRGRVLRTAPGKEHAEIYDMIVVPPQVEIVTSSERNLIRKELIRFAEFADIALNAGEARGILFALQKRFNLMDI